MQLNFIGVSSDCGAAAAGTRAVRGGACLAYRQARPVPERPSTSLRELLHVRREPAPAPPRAPRL